eukprot:1196163-Prorocentrum_minimum.AAC.8
MADAREFMALYLAQGREMNSHARAGTRQEFMKTASFLVRAERLRAFRGTLVSDRKVLLDSGVEAQRFECGGDLHVDGLLAALQTTTPRSSRAPSATSPASRSSTLTGKTKTATATPSPSDAPSSPPPSLPGGTAKSSPRPSLAGSEPSSGKSRKCRTPPTATKTAVTGKKASTARKRPSSASRAVPGGGASATTGSTRADALRRIHALSEATEAAEQVMAAERRGGTRGTREPSPDAGVPSQGASPPEREGLGNGVCFRLSGDDGEEGVLEHEPPGSALYPVPAEKKDKYYLIFRHSGDSLEADPEVPVLMVSESRRTSEGTVPRTVYRTHRSLRQGRVQEDWSHHSLLE